MTHPLALFISLTFSLSAFAGSELNYFTLYDTTNDQIMGLDALDIKPARRAAIKNLSTTGMKNFLQDYMKECNIAHSRYLNARHDWKSSTGFFGYFTEAGPQKRSFQPKNVDPCPNFEITYGEIRSANGPKTKVMAESADGYEESEQDEIEGQNYSDAKTRQEAEDIADSPESRQAIDDAFDRALKFPYNSHSQSDSR